MAGLRNLFRQPGDVSTVPEMLESDRGEEGQPGGKRDSLIVLHGHGAAADTDPAPSLPWLEPLCRHWDAMSTLARDT